MAKQKTPLTPEQAEIKAMKKEKSSMGWTKFWAVVLALVLTVGVVFIGKTTADKALEAAGSDVQAGEQTGEQAGGEEQDLLGGEQDLLGDENAPAGDENAPAGDENAPAGDENAPAGDENAPAGDKATFSKANAHEMFNKWTAAAAKGNYKFTRVCGYTADGAIDVGGATDTLNRVIKLVDKNASLDSVVGGFLGIGNREGEVKNGVIPEGMNKQYALKAMTLTAADVKGASANGNTYKIQLNNHSNPQKDGKNGFSRATNDFFTHQEVVDGITALTSAIKVESTDVQYYNILLTAVVDGDNLKSLEISYGFSAKMVLKVGISITGTGKATNKITYTIG